MPSRNGPPGPGAMPPGAAFPAAGPPHMFGEQMRPMQPQRLPPSAGPMRMPTVCLYIPLLTYIISRGLTEILWQHDMFQIIFKFLLNPYVTEFSWNASKWSNAIWLSNVHGISNGHSLSSSMFSVVIIVVYYSCIYVG